MIRDKISELLDHGVIQPSNSRRVAQILRTKCNRTLRLCVDGGKLKSLLVLDSGGLGDISARFEGPRAKKYFTRLIVANGFTQLNTVEEGCHKAAFEDADGRCLEFVGADIALIVLPAGFTRVVRRALGTPHPDVVSWFDIPISSYR